MIFRNNISIATICPLTFVESKVKTSVYPERFLQVFGETDPIHVQFLSDNNLADTFYLRAYHAVYDTYIGQVQFTKQTLSAGKYYWDATYQCATLLAEISAIGIPYIDNHVYFQIETTDIYNYSLPVKIESSAQTIQLRYHNSFNVQETVFGDFSFNASFVLRLDGGFAPKYFKPSNDYETFKNQNNEPSVVYAKPYSTYTLSLNNIDDVMFEKLNYILCLDTLLIDNIQYVREGELTASDSIYGLRNIQFDLIPKTNRMTQNIQGDVMLTTQDGTLITDEDSNVLTISPQLT